MGDQQLLGKVIKALYSGAIALLGDISVTLTGSQSLGDLTTQQWTLMAVFTLSAVGGTFGLAGWAGPKMTNGSSSGGTGG